jgi:hypothetical protein
MTKVQARRILDLGGSTSLKKAQLSYEDKRRQLQRCLAAGVPVTIRQKAIADLAEVTSAWHTLQGPTRSRARPTKMPRPMPAASKTSPPSAPAAPQTLGEAWDLVVSLLPFSRPVNAVIVVAALVLLMLISVATLGR